jgi:hypothetical protein
MVVEVQPEEESQTQVSRAIARAGLSLLRYVRNEGYPGLGGSYEVYDPPFDKGYPESELPPFQFQIIHDGNVYITPPVEVRYSVGMPMLYATLPLVISPREVSTDAQGIPTFPACDFRITAHPHKIDDLLIPVGIRACALTAQRPPLASGQIYDLSRQDHKMTSHPMSIDITNGDLYRGNGGEDFDTQEYNALVRDVLSLVK